MAIMDRARRGQFDLAGVPDELRGVLAAALDPEPARRPTLEALLGWLRDPAALSPVASTAPRGSREAPPATLPLSFFHDDPSDGLADGATLVDEDVEETTVPEWTPPPVPVKPGFATLTRRFVLWLGASLVAGAGLSAYPWITLAVMLVLVWLLRTGSLAASTVSSRRELRGAKWYDGPRLVLGAPWDLVRSVPSTLVLWLWSVGIAVAAVLVCYAVAAPLASTLFVGGAVLGAMLWLGPGGERVRGPLARVVHPLAGGLRRWVVAVLVLVAVGAGCLWSLSSGGPDWAPGTGEPAIASLLH